MTQLTGVSVSVNELNALAVFNPRFRLTRQGTGSYASQRASRAHGRGMDLDEVRLYQPGDDVRNIDWNVTARKQKPHTKIYTEERERPTLVIVDQRRSMFFGSRLRMKSVLAAEIAARIAWQTLAVQDRVGGMVISVDGLTTVEPMRHKRAVAKLLGSIATASQSLESRAQRQDVEPISYALGSQVRRIARGNHRIVIVSDFALFTTQELSELEPLGVSNRLQVFFVFDELERTLPPANVYSVSDGQRHVRFNSGSGMSRSLYTRRFDNRLARVQTFAQRSRAEFEMFSTADDLQSVKFHE